MIGEGGSPLGENHVDTPLPWKKKEMAIALQQQALMLKQVSALITDYRLACSLGD